MSRGVATLVLTCTIALLGWLAPTAATVPDDCRCADACLRNGWCAAHTVGYVAGVRVSSAILFEVLDAHGHDIDPAVIECSSCQTALASDGFCETCGMGYVAEQLYFSRLTYLLARGVPRAAADITCTACRTVATRGRAAWCAPCGSGMVGNVTYTRRDLHERASGELRTLHEAVQASSRCETCAVVRFTGGLCSECDTQGAL